MDGHWPDRCIGGSGVGTFVCVFKLLAFRLMLARSFICVFGGIGAGSGIGGFIVLVGIVPALALARCCARRHWLWRLFVLTIFVGVGSGTSAGVRLLAIRPSNGVVVAIVRDWHWHCRAEKKTIIGALALTCRV